MAEHAENHKEDPHYKKKQLQSLHDKVQIIEESEDFGVNTLKDLELVIDNLNELENQYPISKRLKHADETLIEFQVLNSAGGIVHKCVNIIESNSNIYECNEFAKNILAFLKEPNSEQELDYFKLKNESETIIDDLPNLYTLFGSYDVSKVPEPKLKKQRTKKVFLAAAARKEPKLVIHHENKEEDTITGTVEFLLKVLKEEFEKNNKKPICYYRYTVDSNSIRDTIENMFYTSFVIRDGKAKLSIDKNGFPMIEPVRSRDLKDFQNSGTLDTEAITSLTMDMWKELSIQDGYIQSYKNRNIS